MTAAPRLVFNLARSGGVTEHLRAARFALGAGIDGIGFADSPRLFPDPFLASARVLAETPAALSGPCVMGLGLHHPSVVARSLVTMIEQFPGRTLLAVARGESSVYNEGLRPPSLPAYGGLLEQLRERISELAPQLLEDQATLLGAASGPRTIELTARLLGGVLLDVGADPEVITRALAVARAQDPGTRCWLFLRAVVTESEHEAVAAAAPILGSCAARLIRSPSWYDVDPEQVPRMAAVADAHDYRRHGTAEAGAGRDSDSEIDAVVRDRFLLTGSTTTITNRLRPLAELGIEGVVIAGATAGVEHRLAATAGALRTGMGPHLQSAPSSIEVKE